MSRELTSFEKSMTYRRDGAYQLCQLGFVDIFRYVRGEEVKDQLMPDDESFGAAHQAMLDKGWEHEGPISREDALEKIAQIQLIDKLDTLMRHNVDLGTLALLAGPGDEIS